MSDSIEELLGRVHIGDLPRRRICRVAPSATLGEVHRLLDEEHSVAVLVFEEDRLVGIFTERDVLYRTALTGDKEAAPETPIGELMTRELTTVRGDQLLADAIRTMTAQKVRHLPVVDAEGRETGLIGGRDLLKMIADHFPETLLNLPPRLHQKLTTAEGG